MFKKLFAFFAAMSLVAAFAAVDVNKGSEAELDSIKGIGPATSKQIMTERKKAEFKNWDDLISRVKGLGDKTAAKLSEGYREGRAALASEQTITPIVVAKPATPQEKANIGFMKGGGL